MSGMTDKKRKLTQTEWDIAFNDGKDWAEHGWQLPPGKMETAKGKSEAAERAQAFLEGYCKGCARGKAK